MAKKKITLDPRTQVGHICKPTALSFIEQYYGKQIGFSPIPLRKAHIQPYSLRQLAKKHGSVQGEVLEITRLQEMCTDLGYETEIVDFSDNYPLFKQSIIKQISANNLIIGFFAVNRYTASPTPEYDDNEHAAVINGFDEENDTITMTHWGREHVTPFKAFYKSTQCLPSHRAPEYYFNIKHVDRVKKYERCPIQDDTVFSIAHNIKKSITPIADSGFRAKILVIKQPKLEAILKAREKLIPGHGVQGRLLDHLALFQQKIKDWELEIRQNPSRRKILKPAIDAANRLKDKITESSRNYCNNLINQNLFKAQCLSAIAAERSVLETHRGWKRILGNLTLAILSLGVGFAVAGLVNLAVTNGKHFLFFNSTDSGEKLNNLEKEVQTSLSYS